MDVERLINELKINLMKKVSKRDFVPADINKIIDEIRNALINKNEEMQINYSNVQEYIDSQFDVFKRTQLMRIGQLRKDGKLEDIFSSMNKLKRSILKEGVAIDILENSKNEDKKEVKRTTFKVLDSINDLLTDIYSHQRKILSARGYSQRQIEDIISENKRLYK